MLDRLLTRKRRCRNTWELQPRNARGWWLSYDGSSPGLERAAREAERADRTARVNASIQDAAAGFIVSHILRAMLEAPAPVREALAAWDVPLPGT